MQSNLQAPSDQNPYVSISNISNTPNPTEKHLMSPAPPTQMTFQPSALLTPAHPPLLPSGQGLITLEIPLLRFITQGIPYKKEELRTYVVQAIKLGQIAKNMENDQLAPSQSEMVLKRCREESTGSRKSTKFKKLTDSVRKLLKDPEVRKEGEKKGRLASESNPYNEENTTSKTSLTSSPKN